MAGPEADTSETGSIRRFGNPHDVNVTAAAWDSFCSFAKAVNFTFVFGLNARRGMNSSSGDWDPSNARSLLEHSRSIGCPVSGWELGNELNLKTKDFTPKMDAQRAVGLMNLVSEQYGPGPGEGTPSSPWRIGPDVTHAALFPKGSSTDPPFLQQYFGNLSRAPAGPQTPLDVVTWHHYLPAGLPLAQYLDPSTLDEVATGAKAARSLLDWYERSQNGSRPQLWLGESGIELNNKKGTGTPGHVPGLDDGFAGLLVWLDKVGTTFSNGHQGLLQQDVTSVFLQKRGPDGRRNTGTFESVAPVAFGSLLWKEVVGRGALAIGGGQSNQGSTLRVYGYCGAGQASGRVVVLAINMAPVATAIAVSAEGGIGVCATARDGGGAQWTDSESQLTWTLRAYPVPSNYSSSMASLGDQPLQFGADGGAPALLPLVVPAGSDVPVPGFSAVFVAVG